MYWLDVWEAKNTAMATLMSESILMEDWWGCYAAQRVVQKGYIEAHLSIIRIWVNKQHHSSFCVTLSQHVSGLPPSLFHPFNPPIISLKILVPRNIFLLCELFSSVIKAQFSINVLKSLVNCPSQATEETSTTKICRWCYTNNES